MEIKTTTRLSGRRILLVISGGIAAYKALELIRRLRDHGADVRCILTEGGAHFITPLSVAALSVNKVYTDLFSLTDEQEMGHIRLARDCDLVLVAPASANMIAKMAYGLAEDLASTVLLATDKPVMLAPAMNPVMWDSAATQDNLQTLQKRGVEIILPDTGEMACGETGQGRLAEVGDIVSRVLGFFAQPGPLSGLKALVTSGPTHEPLDPVRFLGNRSSGKQGHAIARALALAGAEVTLVSGPVNIPDPAGVHTVHVETAKQMHAVCQAALPCDIAVCVAAVADFRPERVAEEKIKKSGNDGFTFTLKLTQNPDILAALSQHPQQRPRLVIGFAAETHDRMEHAKQKLLRKNCDWLVLNDVSGGKVFGEDRNTATLLQKKTDGTILAADWPLQDKTEVARRLVQEIALRFTQP